MEVSGGEGVFVAAFLHSLNLNSSSRVHRFFKGSREVRTAVRGSAAGGARRTLLRICGGLHPNRPPALRATRTRLSNLFFSTRECSLSEINECGCGGGLTLSSELTNGALTRPVVSPRNRFLTSTNRIVDRRGTLRVRGTNIVGTFISTRNGRIGVISGNVISVSGCVSFSYGPLNVGRGMSCEILSRVLRGYNSSRRTLGRRVRVEYSSLVPGRVVASSVFTAISCLVGLTYNINMASSVSRLKGHHVHTINRLLRGRVEVNFSEVREIVHREVALRIRSSRRSVAPRTLVGVHPIITTVGRFFNSSPLSRFVSRGGPLTRLARGEELSTLNPNNLSESHTNFRIHSIRCARCNEVYPVRAPRNPGVNLVSCLTYCDHLGRCNFVRTPCHGISGRANYMASRIICVATSIRSGCAITRTGRPLSRGNEFLGGHIAYHRESRFLAYRPRGMSCVSISPGVIISITATVVPFLRGSSTGHTLVNTGVRHRTIPLLGARTPIMNANVRCGTTCSSNIIIITGHKNAMATISTRSVRVAIGTNRMSECRLIGFDNSGRNAYVGRHPVISLRRGIRSNRIVTSNPTAYGNRISLNGGTLVNFVA